MKKILLLLFAVFAVFFTMAAAQVETPEPVKTFELSSYFANLAGFVTAVLLITQFVLKYLNTKFKQVISWIISFVLAAAAWFLNLGILAGVSWYWIFIYGLAAGLCANGVFDITIVKTALKFITAKKTG